MTEILETTGGVNMDAENQGTEEVRYHLYVAPFNSQTAAIAMEQRYARATSTHVMIYNTGECPELFKEMTDAELHLLPKESLKWLREVNTIIIQQFIAERMEEHERANKKFLEEFEREMQKEREKLLEQRGEA